MNDIFISLYPSQRDVASVFINRPNQWMTCKEIAEKIGGISSKQVYYYLSVIMSKPGGKDAIEVQQGERFTPNKYRYIP